MDRGCRRDSRETGAQTEKRSPGRAPATDIAGGGSLSEDLDTQPGKPKSAATVVASASLGADAHAGHESVACGSPQRRDTTEEGVVAASGPSPVGKFRAGLLEWPTKARPIGLAGSTDYENPGTDPGSGGGSREAASSAPADDPSWCGSINRAGVRTGDRNAGALWLRQADRQLCGTGAVRGIQWRSATVGTHHQTGQLSAAFSAGGSSSGDGPH